MITQTPIEFQDTLRRAVAEFEPLEGIAGQGIVTCAGGLRLFTNVYVLIRLLRDHLHCTLPIEVWNFGSEELSPRMRHLLFGLNVEIVDAHPADGEDGERLTSAWQLKAHAILNSRFAEVLYLDADQVPAADPAYLFSAEPYVSTGAQFWPDTLDIRADNPVWSLLGLPAEDTPSWESGQMVIDKRRHWQALQLSSWLNRQSDVIYDKIYGDKDTFLLAWRWLKSDCSLIPHMPFRDARVIVQRDLEGTPLFHHRTDAKWLYAGRQFRYDGEIFADICEAILEELRVQWNGGLFFPPDRSLAARSEEARLERLRARLEVVGDHVVHLQFGEAHEILSGRSADRQNWHVEQASDSLEIVISDGARPSYRIRKTEAGHWEGNQIATVAGSVRLIEEAGSETRTVQSGLVESLVAASGLDETTSGGSQQAKELTVALTLLLRAEPGIRPAIEALQDRPAAFASIADTVLSRVPNGSDHAPVRNTDVLRSGYREKPMEV